MRCPEPFVDIHCHLVPEIDDGSKSWEETLAMARMAVEDGIGTVIVTPHQLGAFAHNTGAVIRERTAALQAFLRQHDVPLQVLPGGDVRIEPDMVAGLKRGDVMSLADRRKHVLLELPHELYFPLEGVLAQLRAADMVGILSHPERNEGLLHEPELIEHLVRGGCLMQVTAGSVTGTFGPASQQCADWMLKRGLVHFLATDAHGPKSRRPLMQRAFAAAAEIVGFEAAVAMCCRNPAAVAAGQAVRTSSPAKTTGWAGWFGRRKAG